MNRTNPEEIKRRLAELNVEHRDLDEVINSITQDVRQDGPYDELQLKRLKKRKLQLKDNITLLQMQLVPDILA